MTRLLSLRACALSCGMKIKLHINKKNSHNKNISRGSSPLRSRALWRASALLGTAAAGVLLAAQPATAHDKAIGSIFVIAMENHNFVQPGTITSPQQIFGNPAAPFLNSLVTPGNSNAVQVSFATAYFNAGNGVHPSEPNYVWAEAGTDFGVHTDADPAPAAGNTFFNQTPHLTGQLDGAGIPWKNYQEDVQLSLSATHSASGTNGPVNPYNGTTQFNYAVKHNPMAFFADTALRNVYPIAQLTEDLANNNVGRYNWITPDQFNDAHSALNGGFTYNGTLFTGDQASIAQGDNFLSIIVPQIMASAAYKNNGVIIIWWDETEDGDTSAFTIPEIVISPVAKGNAYASTVPMSHSSDTKTVEEVLGLPFVNNHIPVTETNVSGGFNDIQLVNDLSDLFVPGAVPAVQNISVTSERFQVNPFTGAVFQRVFVTNIGTTPAPAPLFLALDNLPAGVTLLNSAGSVAVLPPLQSPYVKVLPNVLGDFSLGFGDVLFPGQTRVVTLEFLDPSGTTITYNARVLSVTPTP